MKLTIDELITESEKDGTLEKKTYEELQEELQRYKDAYNRVLELYEDIVEKYNFLFRVNFDKGSDK